MYQKWDNSMQGLQTDPVKLLSFAKIDERNSLLLLKCMGNLHNIMNASVSEILESTPVDKNVALQVASFFNENN